MTVSSIQKREQALARLIARANQLHTNGERTSRRFSRWRLGIVLAGFFLCFFLYKAAWFHAGNLMVGVFLIIFFVVAHYHNSLENRLHRLRLWRDIKKANLARLRLDWGSIPLKDQATWPSHAYADDLDITGAHSLLGLLDVTISEPGRDRLADWLLRQNTTPLTTEEWSRRQAVVKELTPLYLLRDRLALEARLISPEPLNGARIQSLLENPVHFPQLTTVLATGSVLCALTLVLVVGSVVFGLQSYWVLSFGLYAGLYFFTSGYLEPVFARVLALHHELEKFVAVVRLLEKRSFKEKPYLRALTAPLISQHNRPSAALKRLARICHGLSVKAHPLIHLGINAIVPWDLGLTHRLRGICDCLRPALPQWLDHLATLDTATSLGAFACLNPEYVWPSLDADPSDAARPGLTAKGLGHPLLPASRRVTNDIEICGRGRMLLVTGSNMSGKSTFLRTIGINLCLAQAGAPVCAESFNWTWLRLYCCVRVTDSLEEGLSYFYMEVKRLKTVLDAVSDKASRPVLFLIDEIFKGTNNRERLLGSEAFIETLRSGNGLGLITTHDLELARLETDDSGISNAHFQETVEGNELHFDYRLRPGPCPTTNALRIMAKEGLPIPNLGNEKGINDC